MTITVITRYDKEDPDCWGEYRAVDIVDEEGALYASYGDESDDHGLDRAIGFLDGVRNFCDEEIIVIEEDRADWDEK